jgi:hypothetical protein
MGPDEVQEVLRAAREEHERAREALGNGRVEAMRPPAPTGAALGAEFGPELAELEAKLVWIFG